MSDFKPSWTISLYRNSVKVDFDSREDAERFMDRVETLDITSEGEAAKPCTCHPDDNPPVPCAQKYALSECLSAPQPAQPDLERFEPNVGEECGEYLPVMDADPEGGYVNYIYAQAHIAALTAKVDELHGRLYVETEAVTFYRAASIDNRRRAETAEADIARLREALERIESEAGASWISEIARAALSSNGGK